jgi:hypothetical protein
MAVKTSRPVTLKHLAIVLADEHQLTKRAGEAILGDLVVTSGQPKDGGLARRVPWRRLVSLLTPSIRVGAALVIDLNRLGAYPSSRVRERIKKQTRAWQEDFDEPSVGGLASMYPASHDGIFVKSRCGQSLIQGGALISAGFPANLTSGGS